MEIKDCGLCGGTASIFLLDAASGDLYVMCHDCCMQGPIARRFSRSNEEVEEEAIKDWNYICDAIVDKVTKESK